MTRNPDIISVTLYTVELVREGGQQETYYNVSGVYAGEKGLILEVLCNGVETVNVPNVACYTMKAQKTLVQNGS